MGSKSSEVEDTIEGKKTELSTDLGSLTLAETTADSASSEDVSDEEEEEEEEEDKDSCESDQEWDVDSFKDVEYHSDEEDNDMEWRRYVRQCYKSEGFDVELDFLPTSSTRIYTGFYPVKLDRFFSPPDMSGREYMEKMVKIVIKKFNDTKDKNLVFGHIVRSVVKLADGCTAYITFMAKESPEGELMEYQAKADWKAWQ